MKKQITVVGLGNTGKTIVSLLLQEKQFTFSINILDPSESVIGTYLDLSHASILTNHTLCLNDFNKFENSEFIFHTAGASVKSGQNRNSIVHESLELTKHIFGSVKFINEPYIIVISNPVDVICTYMNSDLKLTTKQIIGTGTLLDTARLQVYINNTGVTQSKSLVVGEHGDHMVFAIFDDLSEKNAEDVKYKTLNSAKEIKKTQGATYYGVAQCSVKILDVILNNDREHILPISINQNNELVFSSVESSFDGLVFKPVIKQYSNSVKSALKNSIKSIEKTYLASKK